MKSFLAVIEFFMCCWAAQPSSNTHAPQNPTNAETVCCAICMLEFSLNDATVTLEKLKKISYEMTDPLMLDNPEMCSYVNFKCADCDPNLPDFKFECPYHGKHFLHLKCYTSWIYTGRNNCPVCTCYEANKANEINFEIFRWIFCSNFDFSTEEALFNLIKKYPVDDFKNAVPNYLLKKERLDKLIEIFESKQGLLSGTEMIEIFKKANFFYKNSMSESYYRVFLMYLKTIKTTKLHYNYLCTKFNALDSNSAGDMIVNFFLLKVKEKSDSPDLSIFPIFSFFKPEILKVVVIQKMEKLFKYMVEADNCPNLSQCDKIFTSFFQTKLINRPEFIILAIETIINSAGNKIKYLSELASYFGTLQNLSSAEKDALKKFYENVLYYQCSDNTDQILITKNHQSFINFIQKFDTNIMPLYKIIDIIKLISKYNVTEGYNFFKIPPSKVAELEKKELIAVLYDLSIISDIFVIEYIGIIDFRNRDLDSNIEIILAILKNHRIVEALKSYMYIDGLKLMEQYNLNYNLNERWRLYSYGLVERIYMYSKTFSESDIKNVKFVDLIKEIIVTEEGTKIFKTLFNNFFASKIAKTRKPNLLLDHILLRNLRTCERYKLGIDVLFLRYYILNLVDVFCCFLLSNASDSLCNRIIVGISETTIFKEHFDSECMMQLIIDSVYEKSLTKYIKMLNNCNSEDFKRIYKHTAIFVLLNQTTIKKISRYIKSLNYSPVRRNNVEEILKRILSIKKKERKSSFFNFKKIIESYYMITDEEIDSIPIEEIYDIFDNKLQ